LATYLTPVRADSSKIFLDWLQLFSTEPTKSDTIDLAIIIPIFHFRIQKSYRVLKLLYGRTLPHKSTECNK